MNNNTYPTRFSSDFEESYMKTIITYGIFDLLHSGHINLLRRDKELGDYLIVGISTDAFNRAKEKQAFHRYHERKLIIDAIRYVDQTIPEDSWDQKRIDRSEERRVGKESRSW